jgi:hypothetical protein
MGCLSFYAVPAASKPLASVQPTIARVQANPIAFAQWNTGRYVVAMVKRMEMRVRQPAMV